LNFLPVKCLCLGYKSVDLVVEVLHQPEKGEKADKDKKVNRRERIRAKERTRKHLLERD
jgi:hypothetical protein